MEETVQRGMAYRRYVRNKAIHRKKRISNAVYSLEWYKCDGRYSKGKIHCGCGLCKPGKKYGIPAIRDMREIARERLSREDYNLENYLI
ncbi:MAG: hypothetical protein K2O73_03125 [Lachnospiraceae bacterium]|nr:hypothetical protein [Lachnospiraceae bacterium]